MNASCPNCGVSLAEGQGFCVSCGARQNPVVASGPAALHCNGCGAALQPGNTFCVTCGTRVDPSVPTAIPVPVVRTSSFASVPESGAKPGTTPVENRSGNLFVKIVIAALALVALATMLAMGSCFYIGYKVKKKAEQAQTEYRSERIKTMSEARPGARIQPGSAAPVPAPRPGPNPAPLSASLPGMADESERTVGGAEADLLVRTGAVNNFGFGWPKDFDPFSGNSSPSHPFPHPYQGAPEGLKRILVGSVVTPADHLTIQGDGYSDIVNGCYNYVQKMAVPDCKGRAESMPVPISLAVGDLPSKIDAVLVQIFVDDFQAPLLHSHFQVSLNGTRIPSFESAMNSLDQSGPIGKLITLYLLPEYWPLLKSGTVKLLIDDPTTHTPDGYAIDFVRILVNPRSFKYQVSIDATVLDADKHLPISGATVSASLVSATTDEKGQCTLQGLPAGLVTATASAPGYDENSVAVDLAAGQKGSAELQLHLHQEGTAALEKSISETGSATIYGIHFDTDSAKLRPDSTPALQAILGLMNNHVQSRWIISGHTDNQGDAGHNQTLSEARAASVVTWLKAHAVAEDRLVPQGYGASRPVADNSTANGRALNRRVEIAQSK